MSVIDASSPFTSKARLELQQAVDELIDQRRDRQAMLAACERMDRMREEILRLFGLQDAAVELVRRTRA
jgi:hypothetical protein